MRRVFIICLLAAACGPAGGPSSGTLAIDSEPTSTTLGNQRSKPEQMATKSACVEPTLEAIRKDILVPRCATANCHVADGAAADLDLSLELEALEERLLEPASQSPSGMPLVTFGSLGSSYLYLKVFLASPLVGSQMPKDGPLTECEIDAIRGYIDP